MIIVLVKVSEYLCSMTPSHQPVWADGLDLFVLSIKENFLHYSWKNRIMDLLGFNTRRYRFNIILLPRLIFYAGKQAMTLIRNVAVT